MIPRAGSSSLLSVGIVVLAAIVLHRPEESRGVEAAPSAPKGAPPVPKGEKLLAPVPKPPATRPSPPPVPEPAKAEPPPSPKPAPVSKHLPDSPLTRVEEGETFSDVAKRVYGDGVDLEALWKMNRDQLATPDAEVRPGMILRTPPM